MLKVLVGLFGGIIIISINILIMIYGWGLKPQNWWWIIGAYIVSNIFVAITTEAIKRGK